jgi:hypothetical protein
VPGAKPENTKKVLDYLKTEVKKGERYFKSRYISKNVGLAPHQIGSIISLLRERNGSDSGIVIQAWSGSRSITWRIDPYERTSNVNTRVERGVSSC